MELIAKLTRRGYDLKLIAKELAKVRPYTLSYVTVFNDLKKIRAEWKANTLRDIGAIQEQELKGLCDQERECWAAWEKSKLAAEKKKQRVRSGSGANGAGQVAERSEEREEQCGDPSFQRLILDIREKRAKILGLNAPERTELSGPNGGPIPVEKHYDDEFLSEWAAGFLLEGKRQGEAAGLRGEPGSEEPTAVRADLRPDVAAERNSSEAGGDSSGGD